MRKHLSGAFTDAVMTLLPPCELDTLPAISQAPWHPVSQSVVQFSSLGEAGTVVPVAEARAAVLFLRGGDPASEGFGARGGVASVAVGVVILRDGGAVLGAELADVVGVERDWFF